MLMSQTFWDSKKIMVFYDQLWWYDEYFANIDASCFTHVELSYSLQNIPYAFNAISLNQILWVSIYHPLIMFSKLDKPSQKIIWCVVKLQSKNQAWSPKQIATCNGINRLFPISIKPKLHNHSLFFIVHFAIQRHEILVPYGVMFTREAIIVTSLINP